MSLIKSSLKLSTSQGLASVLNFIALAFFAQRLGSTVLGIFFLFQSVNGVAKTASNFGVRQAIEKSISEQNQSPNVVASGIVVRGLLLVPVLICVFVFADSVNSYLGADLAVLLLFSIVIDELGQLTVFILKGEVRVGETAELQFIQQMGWVVGGVLLVLAGLEVRALIYAGIFGSAIKSVWGIYKISVPLGTVTRSQMRELLLMGKDFFLPAFNAQIYNWADVLVIGFFLSQGAVGAYEVAWRVCSIMVTFSKALANSLFPQVSSWDAAMDREQIASVLPDALLASYLFVIPSFVGIAILSEAILGEIFGSGYTGVTTVLILLAGGKLVEAAKLVIGPTLRGIGKADLSTRAAVASGLLNVMLNIVLTFHFGLLGAATATTLSVVVGTALQVYFLSRYLPISIQLFESSWLVVSSAVMGLGLVSLQRVLRIDSVVSLALTIFAGALLYFAVVSLYAPMRHRIRTNVRKLIPSGVV